MLAKVLGNDSLSKVKDELFGGRNYGIEGSKRRREGKKSGKRKRIRKEGEERQELDKERKKGIGKNWR